MKITIHVSGWANYFMKKNKSITMCWWQKKIKHLSVDMREQTCNFLEGWMSEIHRFQSICVWTGSPENRDSIAFFIDGWVVRFGKKQVQSETVKKGSIRWMKFPVMYSSSNIELFSIFQQGERIFIIWRRKKALKLSTAFYSPKFSWDLHFCGKFNTLMPVSSTYQQKNVVNITDVFPKKSEVH